VKVQKLEIVLGTLRELLKRHEIPPLARLTVDWVQAAYLNVMSLYDDCRKIVSDGLQVAHELKINLMEYLLLGHGVLSSLKKGDSETVKQYLQRMASGLSFLKPWEAALLLFGLGSPIPERSCSRPYTLRALFKTV
jgi:hypothetical protein